MKMEDEDNYVAKRKGKSSVLEEEKQEKEMIEHLSDPNTLTSLTYAISLPASPDGLFCDLPNDIRQKILSSLTLKQRAIASLVSRKWRDMIALLDDHKLVQTHSTKIYCGFCYCQQNLKLSSCVCRYRVNPLIKLAADNINFTELYLFVHNSQYYMSKEALESRLLTVLHLKGCCNMNYIGDIEELPSLKVIHFDSVCINQGTFSNLINNCPSIVELTLIDCSSLNSISVPPHLNQLKKVHVNCGFKYRHKLEIKARNLREFHLFSSSFVAMRLDLCACTKLQALNIDCATIPDGFPQEVSSAFPSLKSLSLHIGEGLEKIKIMSPELESLSLIDMLDLDDAFIAAPNLRSFKLLHTFELPSSYAVIGSSLMEVEIGLKNACASTRLLELRTFAEYLGENITLSLETDSTESKEVVYHRENVRSSIRPLCVKHITLEVLSSFTPRYESFIDDLFSYFHPRTLLVRVNSDALKYNFIQVLSDELKHWERELESHKRCKYNNNMFWRYLLKGFKILESTTVQHTNQISLEFQWRLD